MEHIPAHTSPLDFSILQGGPWYAAFERLGLNRFRGELSPHLVRFLAGLLVGWLPLLLLSLFGGGEGARAFFHDKVVQANAFFALPVLLAFEPYLDGRLRLMASRPVRLELLSHADQARYHAALVRAGHWRDSVVVHGLLLLMAYGYSLVRHRHQFGIPLEITADSAAPAAVTVWYFGVTLPLALMALLMWLWRFVIWSEVLYVLSRLDLRPVSTHADRTGGLRFLANAQASFAPAVFALGCTLTAVVRLPEAATISGGLLDFSRAHAIYAAGSFAVLNLPLAAFAPKLLQAKRAGDAFFSELIARHGRAFQERWFDREHRPPPLGRDDYSGMIDLSSSYEMATKMRWFPFGVRPTLAITGAAVASLAPRLMMQRQLLEALGILFPKLL